MEWSEPLSPGAPAGYLLDGLERGLAPLHPLQVDHWGRVEGRDTTKRQDKRDEVRDAERHVRE